MEVCRICLATERKMKFFDKKCVLLYELITGLRFQYDDRLPKYACWECEYYMSKYVTFKNRAQSSYRTLTEILSEDGYTQSSVENCNRYKSALAITETLNIFVNEDDYTELEMEINEKSNDNIIDSIIEITDDSHNNIEDENPNNSLNIIDSIIEITDDSHNNFEDESPNNSLNIIDSIIEITDESHNNFEDESLNNNGTLLTDLIISSPIIEDTNSINENKNVEKQSTDESHNNFEDESLNNNQTLLTDLIISSPIIEDTDSINENNNVEKQSTDDSDNNFEDESLNNNETLLTDLIISSPIIEDTDSIKENNNVEKQSPAKLPCVKRKETDTESEISKVKKNSNDINKKPNKTTKLDRVRRKQGSTVKKNKDVKSRMKFREQLDTSILRLTELTLDEQIAEFQDRKKSLNYRSSPYKCENCFKGFSDIHGFNFHMVKHSESSGANVCPVCKTRYRLPSELKTHTNLHLYRVSCLKCNFSTKLLGVAKMHQHSHQGVKYNCPHCNEVYNHKSTILNHLRTKHPSVMCRHCGCSFVNENGLKWHERMVHRADQGQIPADGPVCARCDIRFSCQEALERHRRVCDKHADERAAGIVKPGRNEFTQTKRNNKPNNKSENRHVCEVCGKICQHANHLRSHSYAHLLASKHVKCDRCGNLCPPEGCLYQHKQSHCGTSDGHPCGVCGKTISSKRNLHRHMEIPADGPVCARCDIRFSCQEALERHRRVCDKHADERAAGIVKPGRNEFTQTKRNNKPNNKSENRHVCEVCGKICQHANHLRSHSYAHLLASKHVKCDRCGNLCPPEGCLYQHKQSHCGTSDGHPCGVCGKTISSKRNLHRHMEIHKGLSYKCDYCSKVFGCKPYKMHHMLFVHKKKSRQAKRQPETVVESAAHEADEEWNSP